MTNRNRGGLFRILLAMAVVPLSGAANAATKYSQAQFTEAIAKVRADQCRETQGDPNKMDDCQRLAHIAKNLNHRKTDDKTLADLASLLDTSNDYVRLAVAASLGSFGLRAQFAAPSLLWTLREVDCRPYADQTPAPTIRHALRKMGVTPPPIVCP